MLNVHFPESRNVHSWFALRLKRQNSGSHGEISIKGGNQIGHKNIASRYKWEWQNIPFGSIKFWLI